MKKKSLFAKAVSLVKTAIRSIIALFQGRPVTVPVLIQEDRKEICYTCRNYRVRTDTCAKCGCVVELKTLLAREKCPLRTPKWIEFDVPRDI